DGATADGEGRGVRPPFFDRHDSAPQWRADDGEGFVRYGGRGAGCRDLRLRDGCGQHAACRDQDYAVYVGEKTVGGEMMKREQDGSTADGEGRGVRPPFFDRHDSAPQWRADDGEGFVRYGGRGAGCRDLRLRDGCGQHAACRDQDYAVYVGEKTVGGEMMNRV